MTNLTDAELALVTTEHDLNPEMNNCWSCDEAWPCPTALALAELRELRAERKNFDSAGGQS